MKKTGLAVGVVAIIAILGFATYQLMPSGAPVKEFRLLAGEYAFSNGGENPAIRVRAGDAVKVTLKNVGGRLHHFMIVENVDQAIKHMQEGGEHLMSLFGADTGTVKPKEERSITFKADRPGTYSYACLEKEPEVHAKLGMFGKFVVER